MAPSLGNVDHFLGTVTALFGMLCPGASLAALPVLCACVCATDLEVLEDPRNCQGGIPELSCRDYDTVKMRTHTSFLDSESPYSVPVTYGQQ